MNIHQRRAMADEERDNALIDLVVVVALAGGVFLFSCCSTELAIQESAAELASLEVIGPARSFEQAPPEGGKPGVVLPDGALMYGSRDPGVRSVAWALSPAEQMSELRDMTRATHGAMDHKEHFWCAQGILDRAHAAGRPALKPIRWTTYLHWKAAGDRLVIDQVRFGPTPAAVDAEARACYADAFRGMAVKAEYVPEPYRRGGFFTEWSNCVIPATEGSL